MNPKAKVPHSCALSLLSLACAAISPAAVVSTGQYDTYRSGTNVSETTLNVANVNPTTFGRLGDFAVDGQVFAQPLYVPGLTINGSPANVVFVATMHNSIYAFDASKIGSAPLWQTTLAPSVPAQYASQCPSWGGGPETGILSTPVIDTQSGSLYAIFATTSGSNTYAFYIAALDIATGKQKTGSPNLITASVPGTGYDSVGGKITFNPSTQGQRTALTLANGIVYAGFGSCGPDFDPYHGWIMGFKALDISTQTSVFNTTPNGGEGGVWQSGRGLASDASGNLYAATGNGTDDSTDVSESVVVQLGSTGQKTGVYTDPNSTALNQYDLDLASSGPLYIGSLGLLLAGGKEGVIHVLNPAQIGGSGNPAIQSFVATQPCVTYTYNGCFQIHDGIVYWDNATNPLLYVWGSNDVLRAYRYSGGAFNTAPDSIGMMNPQSGAAALALSSNGGDPNTAVLWAVTTDGYLHAYQAINVAHEIYNSGQSATRDTLGDGTRFVEPVVADGRVYVATEDKVVQVYGLLSSRTSGAATAAFVTTDTATQGSWRKAYGSDGYDIEGDQSANPTYAAPAVSGDLTFTWAASTTEVRALQKASNPADRVAAAWYSGTSFTIDSGITDQNPHQVAIYCLDWESGGRREIIDVLDNNGNILDSETAASFINGVYMVWNVTGHVVFRITTTGNLDAVASGIFFGGPSAQQTAATAKFVKADTTTEGNWRTVYGADGYNIEADQALNPGYAAPVFSGTSTWTWAASTSDVRALQKASNPSDRIVAGWYSGTSFTIDSGITDQNQHQVALYCLDWDNGGRQQTVQVFDLNGNVLDSENATSFTNGTYLVWNVTGHVFFRVTLTGRVNAVVSGIFFGGPLSPATATATFVKTDSTTQGSWRAVYGNEGYSIEADQARNPSYAAPSVAGDLTYTWVASTTDVRALQRAENPADRIAATWYSGTSLTIDTNISDQQQHQVALYCVDWEGAGRQQIVQVLDTDGNVIDTETAAAFTGGSYLVWNITGHVVFRVILKGGKNAVVSGIFFGGPVAQSTAAATFVKADTATQGNWRAVYGGDGYDLEADQSLNPAYAAPVISGDSTWTWAASTSDLRGLQKVAHASDRIAAAWYSKTSFTLDTNISDTQQHQVALYCVDWDPLGRKETFQVLDSNGNILDTETVSSFSGGTYMVWNVTGHVVFRVMLTGNANAVVSGIFFGGPLSMPTASANFVKTDSTTQGNWHSVYGAGGYSIEADQALNPSYAAPVVSGGSAWTWAASSTDPRALQKAENLSDRIAAGWYAQGTFSIDSGIQDRVQHEIALYCIDWDKTGRQETIQVLDSDGNILDTRNLAAFSAGVYVVWNVSGDVTFRITLTGSKNAVVSGIFYGQ